jgi:hypothetical protein
MDEWVSAKKQRPSFLQVDGFFVKSDDNLVAYGGAESRLGFFTLTLLSAKPRNK